MANIFNQRPDALTVETRVTDARDLPDGSRAIQLGENPLRPAGGGQPRDHGIIHHAGDAIPVEDVYKASGETWIQIPRGQLCAGSNVTAQVDQARRCMLSRAHSLTHLAMASIREFVPGYQSKGADIAEDGSSVELRFLSEGPVPHQVIRMIDRQTRSRILRPVPVRVEHVKSTLEGDARYPFWRIDPDLGLNGKIRVIVIDGVDANPCSGSHVSSTEMIGPYAIKDCRINAGNLNRLRIEVQDAWTYWYQD